MIQSTTNSLLNSMPQGIGSPPSSGELGGASTSSTSGANFADILKSSISEVSQMQQDASQAVDDLAAGKSQNMTGVMTAVEKSDLAFKTLLAIRAKLMDAYNEIKGLSI